MCHIAFLLFNIFAENHKPNISSRPLRFVSHFKLFSDGMQGLQRYCCNWRM